ncbi:RNA-directed DNA polymerase, eukaryota [Tanacetum coccineum]
MAASSHRYSFQSNEDQTRKISHSIFVTNFTESVNSRELWKACSAYGTVVDVFIPSKKSKVGKRFAFVRFIKVFNVDRLVENLCTIWIGRYHLYANKVRFERPNKPHSTPDVKNGAENKSFNSSGSQYANGRARSYANIVNGASAGLNGSLISPSPALVLDDSCLVDCDLSKHVMGKVKEFSSIPNLYTLLLDEGFSDVKITYLGGMWVMLEFDTEDTKNNMMEHIGINSWFDVIQDAENDFVSDERIVWVDIEGVPLKAWSRETFIRIGKKWGEMLELETMLTIRKVFMVRAKELFTWNPSFVVHKERIYNSEDESVHAAPHLNEGESDNDNGIEDDEVPDTIFGTNSASASKKQKIWLRPRTSPFNVSFLPGFLLMNRDDYCKQNIGDTNGNVDKEPSTSFNAKVMNISQEVPEVSNCEFVGHQNFIHNGGSVLGVLDDIIKVGQSMGYTMEGCAKDLENIIGLGHKTKKEWIKELACKYKLNFLAIQETKMNMVSHMDVKFMWGNSNYDYVCSGSLGSSGGILCMWEASIFKKDNATISDNFVALYGMWLPTNSKIMFVVVYAPQQASSKRVLWEYISILLDRWVGDTIIMGDFNEVRSIDERRGSTFNPYSARRFDQFISNSGLVDVKLEGYTFTWSHPSASKMSKLDRFLVSQGIILSFPSLTALCLDRHLSDHRPILLREVHLDFGPTPFRFYHSWLDFVGFDDMINCTWKSFSHADENRLIRFKKKLQDLKVIIRRWINEKRRLSSCLKSDLTSELGSIDKELERGVIKDDQMLRRLELKLEGDENSKFFHGIIQLRGGLQLAIRVGIFVDGIGCVYKVVTKILANRLALVISDLVSNTQSAFISGRQILDGPFILDEILNWCKRKKKKAMFFKVDFAKAYDSVRWDYLIDVLEAFGFGPTWCNWIRGTFSCAKASILVNGSPSKEFSFHRGLKQGDPLAPYLFILVMESLHLSFLRVVDEGLFKGIHLSESVSISHLFYADDASYWRWSVGIYSNILNILKCFYLASGLQINIHKSQVLGVGVPRFVVEQAASTIGCSVMNNQFTYLGVKVGEVMSRHKAWEDTIHKLTSRLSKWKAKTLSIGGRLTLLKSVLGASPIYSMSIFKVPKGVLKIMEAIRNRFFNGADISDRKITWAAWDKILASKKNGGLGVSSFFALNRALLLKWVWRFVSQDGSLWYRVIQALYGDIISSHSIQVSSNWSSILRELQVLRDKGFDFWSHCKKRIGNGCDTRFWFDCWIGESPLHIQFPRLFALEQDKDISVAIKLNFSLDHSFRRCVRDGIEFQQMTELKSKLDLISLSNSRDLWFCDLTGDGEFRVKEVRNFIDDLFLPSFDLVIGGSVFLLRLMSLFGGHVEIAYLQGLTWHVEG